MTLRIKDLSFLVQNENTLASSTNTQMRLTKTLVFLRWRTAKMMMMMTMMKVSSDSFKMWDSGKP